MARIIRNKTTEEVKYIRFLAAQTGRMDVYAICVDVLNERGC